VVIRRVDKRRFARKGIELQANSLAFPANFRNNQMRMLLISINRQPLPRIAEASLFLHKKGLPCLAMP